MLCKQAQALTGAQRVLVITYKDVEAAFAGIPGVETAHYNAIAGLDDFELITFLVIQELG